MPRSRRSWRPGPTSTTSPTTRATGSSNAYGPNLERLVEIKRRYDPANLFRLNHNIDPGG